MNALEVFRHAVSNLADHKLRSGLTMLGMIFGVGAVISMLAIGTGGERQALAMIDRLGVRNVILRARAFRPEDRAEIRKKSLGLSLRDAEAIEEAIPDAEAVVPRIEVKPYKIRSSEGKTEARVYGVSYRQPELADVRLAEGRFLDKRDEAEHSQVCVVGPLVRRDLFGDGPAVGKEVKINDVWFVVIGVLAGQAGAESVSGIAVGSTDREIDVPVSTALRKFDRDPLDAPVDELVVRVRRGTAPGDVSELAAALLDRLHAGVADYDVVVPDALLDQARRTHRLFNLIMGSIAGISLLVGGIGIMNIMLATVLERTREIGIRRAIGARRADIRSQFFIESFAISAIGGGAGILIGIVLARAVAAYAGWQTVVTVWSLLLSTGVSVTVGLVSGIFPATRAASLDPIEALRHE